MWLLFYIGIARYSNGLYGRHISQERITEEANHFGKSTLIPELAHFEESNIGLVLDNLQLPVKKWIIRPERDLKALHNITFLPLNWHHYWALQTRSSTETSNCTSCHRNQTPPCPSQYPQRTKSQSHPAAANNSRKCAWAPDGSAYQQRAPAHPSSPRQSQARIYGCRRSSEPSRTP